MSDLNQCTGKVTAPIETTPEKKSNTGSILLMFLLAGGLGGGAFYYFKVQRTRPKNQGKY